MTTISIAAVVAGAGALGAGVYTAGTRVARAPWSRGGALWAFVTTALMCGLLLWVREVSQ